MEYLAIIVEVAAKPFIIIGGTLISAYNWICNGIIEALDNEDVYLAAAYWIVYILGLVIICGSPFLLVLSASVPCRAVGAITGITTMLIGLPVGIVHMVTDALEGT